MPEPQFDSSAAYSPQSATDTQLSLFADNVSKQRSFNPMLYKNIDDAKYFMNTTSMIGDLVNNDAFMGTPVDTDQVFHAEEESIFNVVQVTGPVPVEAAGVETVVTVVAQSFGSKYFNYGVVGDVLEGRTQNVTFRINAITFTDSTPVHTITLQADSVVIADYVSTGDFLRPQFSVNGLSEQFPKGSISGITRYGVTFQAMETSSAEVDQGGYNQGFEFNLSTGNGDQKIIAPRAIMQATLRSWIKKSVAITKADGSTYTSSVTGNTYNTTIGVITAFRQFGLTANYVPGAFQANALRTIMLKMNNRGASSEGDLWGGAVFLDTLQVNALSTLTGGAVQYISGEQNASNERATLRQALGNIVLGKFKLGLKEATEWSHPEIYNYNGGGSSLLTNAWPNSFAIIPKTQVAVPRQLTNNNYTVMKPMFRVIQLQAPATIGGPSVMRQVVQVNPANRQAFLYYLTMAENFAAQTMLAKMGYWGGSVAA